MISGPQCTAARALVEISRAKLSRRSGVSVPIIEKFERKAGRPTDDEVGAIVRALEELGAVFIAENGGGVGVRLKFANADARQIARLEGEGGIVASDRVP